MWGCGAGGDNHFPWFADRQHPLDELTDDVFKLSLIIGSIRHISSLSARTIIATLSLYPSDVRLFPMHRVDVG
jgi:hypothetical protein